MLKWNIALREHLQNLDIDELEDLLLSKKKYQNVDNLLTKLEKVNSVTFKLQSDDVLISKVRKGFDITTEHFPSAYTILAVDSNTAECAVFETTLVKLKLNKSFYFTCDQKKLCMECSPKRVDIIKQKMTQSQR